MPSHRYGCVMLTTTTTTTTNTTTTTTATSVEYDSLRRPSRRTTTRSRSTSALRASTTARWASKELDVKLKHETKGGVATQPAEQPAEQLAGGGAERKSDGGDAGDEEDGDDKNVGAADPVLLHARGVAL